MSQFIIKLAPALPRDDNNGFDDTLLAQQLWDAKIEGHAVQPRVAVVIYGAEEAKVDKKGDQVVKVDVMRVQPVISVDSRRAIEAILKAEYTKQTGAHLLPYEVERVTKQAFVDLPKTVEEIDAEEAEQLDHMSPTDELRKHLERVHGHGEGALVYTEEEAQSKHRTDHEGDLLTGGMEHDESWIGWTRADIELAAGDSEDDEVDTAEKSMQRDADEDDANGIDPAADFVNGRREADPDEGRDIAYENAVPIGTDETPDGDLSIGFTAEPTPFDEDRARG